MTRVLVAVLVILLAVTACAPTMDETAARSTARRWYTTLEREPGALVKGAAVTGSGPSIHEGHAGWEVTIDGAVVLPNLPDGYANPMILFVDGASGSITIIAQG